MTLGKVKDTLLLSNAIEIPQLGFGVYRSPRDICTQSCLTALRCGYRHIDTAQCYGNESEVGQAVKQSGLSRNDIFLTSKILCPGSSVQENYERCLESVRKLDSAEGFVDLMLIHSPNCGEEKRRELWKALEMMYEAGKAKSIGVSNFGIRHIQGLKQYANVWPPHVNQIELHPWLQQREIVNYCNQHRIVVEAYCPLVRNSKATDETLISIAQKHGITPSQVLIRYSLENGWVPLPKSDNTDRIKANAEVLSFSLDRDDIKLLDGLDQGRKGAIVQSVDN